MHKLYIQTHGCQMNEYDSGKMAEVLMASHQLVKTENPEEADVLLLNTCSVREKAQEKVFSELGRWRALKHKKPNLIIGVGGCVASQEGQAILQRAPFVDLVFGPQTIHRLGEMLAERKSRNKAVVDISFPEIEKFDRLPEPRAEGPTAYVTIMEGCSKYCSFCVVPYTRGEEISRPLDDVLAEVVSLTSQGVREITLLGQNVNDYRGPTHEGGTADLAALIEYIASIDGLSRIRFTTSHPVAFSNRLIQAYADVPQLASHLHLPVQSGSDRILAAMKRGYTALEYKAKIRKLRKVRPDISISSDFIIGFPGETQEDFEATMNLIHEVGFDNSFSFIYSPRPGTPAAQLPDDVPMETKKQRLAILQDRIVLNARRISENMIGTTQKILVSGRAAKHQEQMSGRTENNRVVNFLGHPDLIGQMVDVRINEALPNSLRGELVPPVSSS
ncbi:tRNA-2-methylthio-N(6)-dimethylallyladenosine synthase [Aquicella siphonis]|uniref:tRNA-2-methylthio-N(6)-dimethylallyladenosine synthase n=1 Tax=Aquicella siphonis TaxID=254247 RepID=A0A5E4PES2_9COXI|nr:tRNA (N6-isopentenyl adenosine(37)-C2)-methylthiotransferase MiaB [Aquicella siphonis]VVC74861.1 tRNA-2-methylthio-N(6)-dimethylallyladenosine synthase [Aquicella siphonis]